jgi:hypothetical protein
MYAIVACSYSRILKTIIEKGKGSKDHEVRITGELRGDANDVGMHVLPTVAQTYDLQRRGCIHHLAFKTSPQPARKYAMKGEDEYFRREFLMLMTAR